MAEEKKERESNEKAQANLYPVSLWSRTFVLRFKELSRENIEGKYKRILGEIVEWSRSPSGHHYITLMDHRDEKAEKNVDKTARISCVLFGGRVNYKNKFGDLVYRGARENIVGKVISACVERLDVNATRGEYRLIVSDVDLVEKTGDKYEELKKFKEKLTKEGLNKLQNPALRRELPFLPHRVGIITSKTGSVIHDMCDVLLRRFPNLEIRLYPSKVQGEGVGKELAKGVEYFNREDLDWKADVLIIGRGGGSADDLWCFNEEEVVYAVAASKIPIISAVGHETDYTLCDVVADRRAGTPSIAAEMAVPVKADLENRLQYLKTHLQKALEGVADTYALRVDNVAYRLINSLKSSVDRQEMRFNKSVQRLVPALKDSVVVNESRLQMASLRLMPAIQSSMQKAEYRIEQAKSKLQLLSPYAVLQRGYSITTTENGDVVKTAEDVITGMKLKTRLSDGVVTSVVSDS